MGPAAPWHVGSSQTRARTRVPCISRQILNHCATREAPSVNFLYSITLNSISLSCTLNLLPICNFIAPIGHLALHHYYYYSVCRSSKTFYSVIHQKNHIIHNIKISPAVSENSNSNSGGYHKFFKIRIFA